VHVTLMQHLFIEHGCFCINGVRVRIS